MVKPQGGLGRGLGALIPSAASKSNTSDTDWVKESLADEDSEDHGLRIIEIAPSDVVENPHQPRLYFAEDDLEDLKNSISEHGILQPLVVTRKEGGGYELIAGERRLRASKAIGLEKVPVIVRDEITEQKKLELALIENIQRAELNAIEEAKGYQALMELFDLTQQQVSERVGKSRSNVANTLRLLDLGAEMQMALADGRISRSHARTLLAEKNLETRKALFEEMLKGDFTVREAEEVAYGGSPISGVKERDAALLTVEKELMEFLGTKVKVSMNKSGKGKVQISFYSKDDLKELLEKMGKK